MCSVLSGDSQSFMQINYSASLARLLYPQSPAFKDRDYLVFPLNDSKLTSVLKRGKKIFQAILCCAVHVGETSKQEF